MMSLLSRLSTLSALSRLHRLGGPRFARLGPWAAVALLLSACVAGPAYQRPDLKIPAKYRWQDDTSAARSLGDMDWPEVYTDPKLRELIRVALAENWDVRIAAERIEEARAALGVTQLQLLPQLAVGANAGRQKFSLEQLRAGQLRSGNVFGVQANASYELDFWGRMRRANEAARADLLATEYARRAILVSLIADVAGTYFDLTTLNEELAISRRTVGTRSKLVELTHAKHDRGVVTGLDVASTEAQLAAARVAIPQQELAIAQTEHRLSILLGRYPDAISLPAPLDSQPLASAPPPGLPSALLERRPDVQQAERVLVAANARLGVAEASRFPSLTLTGSFGRISTDLARVFTAGAAAWSATASLLQPLLDPQRSVYQVRGAQARRREALYAYSQTVMRALQEVADALIAQQKLAEIVSAQSDQVEALRRASNIARARYEAGSASYVDVTNADRDLFTAELALSTARRDSLLAIVQLYRALGGGWQSETPH